MTKLKDVLFDCLNNVDWEELYKQKLHLLDVISFVQNNADLLYEHLNEVYNTGQEEEPIEINVDATIMSLDGILNLLDALQDTADEEGLWKHPLSDTIED